MGVAAVGAAGEAQTQRLSGIVGSGWLGAIRTLLPRLDGLIRGWDIACIGDSVWEY